MVSADVGRWVAIDRVADDVVGRIDRGEEHFDAGFRPEYQGLVSIRGF